MTAVVWWEIETPAPERFRWFALVRDPAGISFGRWTPNDQEAPA